LKKKYEKPTLTDLKMPIVNAQGFEIMALCSDGNSVEETPAACNTGSGDNTSGSRCEAGNFAGSNCSIGDGN